MPTIHLPDLPDPSTLRKELRSWPTSRLVLRIAQVAAHPNDAGLEPHGIRAMLLGLASAELDERIPPRDP